VRRAFDVISAAVGLVVLSPLFAVIALVIKLENDGPVFYSQPRMGKDFRKFRLLKFRSMVPDADRAGGALTGPADGRITRAGKFLRAFKLDELPQLINLLKGDMRLVGPRPELERFVEMFRPQYALILRERPGLTDPASLVYRQEDRILGPGNVEAQYVTRILPRKLELSLEYQQHRTFLSDLGIIFRTVFGLPWVPRDPSPIPRDTPPDLSTKA